MDRSEVIEDAKAALAEEQRKHDAMEAALPEWWRGWEELDDDGSLSRLFMLPGNRLLTVNFFPGKESCIVSYADPDPTKSFAVKVGEARVIVEKALA